jgi:hypothetical protein
MCKVESAEMDKGKARMVLAEKATVIHTTTAFSTGNALSGPDFSKSGFNEKSEEKKARIL